MERGFFFRRVRLATEFFRVLKQELIDRVERRPEVHGRISDQRSRCFSFQVDRRQRHVQQLRQLFKSYISDKTLAETLYGVSVPEKFAKDSD